MSGFLYSRGIATQFPTPSWRRVTLMARRFLETTIWSLVTLIIWMQTRLRIEMGFQFTRAHLLVQTAQHEICSARGMLLSLRRGMGVNAEGHCWISVSAVPLHPSR